jgi:RimJ/RimL family protein N-acetyltransferase
MKRLETDRLILRKWTIDDKNDLFEYAQDNRVGPNAGWKPHNSVEKSKKIIESFIESDDVYAIILKDKMKVIGSLGVHKRSPLAEKNTRKYRELGAVLNPDYWGKGYVPEGIERVLEYCFEDLDIDDIWCGHFDFNSKSKRVVDKCNFRFQFKKEHVLKRMDNKKVTSLYYKITKCEYKKTHY